MNKSTNSIDISIVSTFNEDTFLEEMLASIFQMGNFKAELILVNAQEGKTLKRILENQKIPQNWKIRLIEEKDNSMYEGIAKGFKVAKGDIVSYLNIDDQFQNNALSLVCDIFKQMPHVQWIVGKTNHINVKAQNIFTGKCIRFVPSFIRSGIYGSFLPFIHQESTFFRRELLETIDLEKFAGFKFAGDFFLWFHFSKKTKLYSVNSIFSASRRHAFQKSTLNKAAYYKEFRQIKKGFPIYLFPKLLWEIFCVYLIPFGILRRLYPGYFIHYSFDENKWDV